jgi:AcrR family transcriptional regulator
LVPSTRQRIVSAATELFLASGYNATSLRMIADQIGITQAAVYYHFRAKDELLAALLGPLLHSYQEVLDEAEERAGRERTVDRRALLGAVFDCLWEHRAALRLISGDLSVEQHPTYAPQIDAIYLRLCTLLTIHGDTTSQPLAHAALGVLVEPLTRLPPENLDGAREVLLDAAVRVLDTPHPSPMGSSSGRATR